ncbi:MAG TPA: TonB family protein [Pyrinomonadaceae bacterium]|nr:TonB family protein [Pyrinomonadaceae bacterium]
MSSIEPGDQFISEDELKSVLERWNTPEPSKSLDKRVINSYYSEFRGSDAATESVPLLQRKKEVVAMKFCSACREEYADKFSFCPVDGTPLNAVAAAAAPAAAPKAKSEESTITSVPVARPEVVDEPVVYEAATPPLVTAAAALPERGEYHLTIMEDRSLVLRLSDELRSVAHEYELTWPEFKRDPFGFTKRSLVGYGQMASKFFGNKNVMVAMGTAVVAMIALVAAIVFLDRSNSAGASRTGMILFAILAFGFLVGIFATWLGKDRGVAVAGAQPSETRNVVAAMMTSFVFIFAILGTVIALDYKSQRDELAENSAEELTVESIFDIPAEQPTPDPGTAGMNKGDGGGSKPKPEKAGGGGGGGRQDPKPASFGKTPQASLEVPQVVAPDPDPPKIKNPSLPVAATVVADPLLVPPDARVLPYGDFKSTSTVPSAGPGTGNGIGTGTGGGIGPGEGGGIGPGRGGNIGGGDRRDGGGGPGGGGGGTDYNKIFSGRDVTSKARVLSKPEPQYTEDARKNQITGTVVLRAVFSSGGQVIQIRAVSGLPYGLTERAIAAARQIKFIPAQKDGRAVSMWMQLEYNFNLY